MLAGIDWGKEKDTVCLLNESGKVIESFEINNNLEGYIMLLNKFRKTSENVIFAIESRNLRIVDFLLAHGYVGYYVDPNAMSDYRKRYRAAPVNSDELSAFILADLLRTDRNNLKQVKLDNSHVRELKELLIDREHFIRDKVRLENRLKACLVEYCPEALQFFNDPAGKVALEFWEAYPTLKDVRNLSLEEISKFLKERKCLNHKIAEQIFRVANGPAVSVPEELIRAKSRKLLGLVRELKAVKQTIEKYGRAIKQLVEDKEETQIYTSLPGAGSILGGALYTLFEGGYEFEDVVGVRAYVGAAPTSFQSGKFKGVSFRFACNHFYRDILTQLAFCSLRKSQWAREHYGRKRREGKSHWHALRCLADLWAKVIYAMWREQKSYNEERHLASVARFWLNNSSQRQR